MLNTSGLKQLLCPEPLATAPTVLIYAEKNSPRLIYSCTFIFHTALKVNYKILNDKQEFTAALGIKINYSTQDISAALMIRPSGLLFEKGIADVAPVFEKLEVTPELFSRNDGHNFDIFSAVFYLISRYEEWQWYEADEHNRFEAVNSILVQNELHRSPVIEEWIGELKAALDLKFPGAIWPKREFQVLSTIDIDNLYAYRHKGFLRTIGASVRDLITLDLFNFIERMRVLSGAKKDPFDIYEDVSDFCFEHKIPLFYFFLFRSGTSFDRTVSPASRAYPEVLKKLKPNQAAVGLHPSYYSCEQEDLLKKETQDFSKLLPQALQFSRQHYLRFNIRTTPKWLMNNGIHIDFTMGFATEAGFRAGTSLPFKYYDFDKDEATDLLFLPFCAMDGVYTVYHTMSPQEAIQDLLAMADRVRKVNGIFTTVFHERSFSDHLYKGFGSLYKNLHLQLLSGHK